MRSATRAGVQQAASHHRALADHYRQRAGLHYDTHRDQEDAEGDTDERSRTLEDARVAPETEDERAMRLHLDTAEQLEDLLAAHGEGVPALQQHREEVPSRRDAPRSRVRGDTRSVRSGGPARPVLRP